MAHFLERMAEGVSSRSYEVRAETFTRQYPDLLFPGRSQLEPGGEQPSFPIRRSIDSINPLTWRRCAREILERGADLTVFNYWTPFLAPCFGTIARLLRRRGVPSVVVVHNVLPHERRPGDVILGRYFLRAAAGLMVLSESVRTDLRRLNVDAPVRMVEHPLYDQFGEGEDRRTARRRLGIEGDPVLLFFGFIREYKGLSVLLESMPAVVAALPDVRLVVAGEFYDDPAPYREVVERLGIEQHVEMPGDYVPAEQVAAYFSAADLVVQPYRSATQSGVAKIAFQYGKPVVTTNVGGLAEVVTDEHTGFVVAPDDPGALGKAIVRFFREDRAANMEAAVEAKRGQLGWGPLLDALEELGGRSV